MEINLCMGCMREIRLPGQCPFCGFVRKRNPALPHVLPYETILGGRYLSGKLLREGAASLTYLGLDLKNNQRVTIKEYYPKGLVTRKAGRGRAVELLPGADAAMYMNGLNRFLSLGKRLAGLGSLPGLFCVSDVLYGNQTVYMITEDETGEFLEQRMGRGCGRLAVADVLYMMRPLIRTLEKVHKAGIIHGDICVDNVCIDHRQARLVDFEGHTNMFMEENAWTSLIRPGYSPLECYKKFGAPGPWTDVYGLCAVMHRALAGKAPKEAVQLMEKPPRRRKPLSLSYSDEPLPLEEVSAENMGTNTFWNIKPSLKNGLILAPKGRYPSMELLWRAIYDPETAPELKHDNPCYRVVDYVRKNGLPKGTRLHERYVVKERVDLDTFGYTYTGYDEQAHIQIQIWEYAHCDFCYDHKKPDNLLVDVNPKYESEFGRGLDIFSEDARRIMKMGKLSGIVTYLDYFYENGTLYIIMEDVHGEALSEFNRKNAGSISFSRMIHIMEPIMDGLALLHRQGLIHGAISPEKIILDGLERGKLTDFSEAEKYFAEDMKIYGQRWKKASRITNCNTAPLRLYKYMAGEYDQYNVPHGPWTDVYGICAVIYGALTGEHPTMMRIYKGAGDIFDDLKSPSALGVPITDREEAILRKGMANMPEDRYQSIDALKRAIDSL